MPARCTGMSRGRLNATTPSVVPAANTVVAWTSVGILMVAALIMCLAVVFAMIWLFVVGLVVAGIALVVGKLLAMAGYGMPRPADNRVTRGVR